MKLLFVVCSAALLAWPCTVLFFFLSAYWYSLQGR